LSHHADSVVTLRWQCSYTLLTLYGLFGQYGDTVLTLCWQVEVDEDEDSDDHMEGAPPDAMYSQVLGDMGRAINGSPSPYATLTHTHIVILC
jgi:hypothetical protein